MKQEKNITDIHISDIPDEDKDEFLDWIIGQTAPAEDWFYRHDYERFKRLKKQTKKHL